MNNSETEIKKENPIKRFFKGLLSKCKKYKFITVVTVLAVILLFSLWRLNNNMKEIEEATYSFVRTTTLSRDGLETAVNVTGSVESANTSTVSYSAGMNSSAPKIKTVNAAVGDYVQEGDIIVVLDNTDILEKITEQQELLSEKAAELYEKYEDAVEAYEDADDAYDNSKTALDAAYNAMVNAEKQLKAAKSSIAAFQTDYDNAVKAEDAAGKTYTETYTKLVNDMNNAESELAAAKSDEADKKVAAEKAASDLTASPEDTALKEAKEAANKAYSDAQAKTAEAQAKYDTAKGLADDFTNSQTATDYAKAKENTKTALDKLNTAKDAANYSSYESAYNNAVSAYNSAVADKQQLDQKAEAAKEAMEQAYEAYEDSQTNDTLEDLQEQLENCNLKAETSGKVTNLNAVVGNTVNGTIATIQDTDSLKISVTVGEADINTVSVGMKCKIRSDATEGYISGTLTQIDPVSSQGGSFGAEVTVDGTAQGLLIGMNADVDIIISEVKGCFTVPADAIGEDEQGSFIYRHTSGEGVDMEFEKVYVTVGENNDYYVEISSDQLNEGDVIRSYADLTIGIETVSGEEAAQMQNFGGLLGGLMGGGNMPNGGGAPGNMGGGNRDFGGNGQNGGQRPNMPSGGGFPGGNGGGMP
ncbi:MAG: HlyD family efflux transporter periplasmic adaptor subunit [Oscillospiraceae bacterium]|nr:HlyD family efflux transporter periplasmic adaptor subunit [Oscillospiraceae bacterium]